jgi:RNA polymerase sigma factor (sigma-70 family)
MENLEQNQSTVSTADNDERATSFLAMIASGGKAADHGLEGLFKMYASRMRAFFKKHRMSDEDASDLIQETFIKVNRSAQQFKGDAKPSTWIWSIARNCMLDQIRGTKDSVSIDEQELDIDAIMQAQGIGQSQADLSRDQDITDCVSRYFGVFAKDSPERASTLQLAVVEGWTMEELAEYLKRSPAATREYLSQCRKKLRDYLLPCADLVGGGV